MRFNRKSPQFSRLNQFLCFVKIAFTWPWPASTLYEVWNASKNGPAAALSLEYLVLFNLDPPVVMSFLLVPHLPSLVALERRTTFANK